MLEVLVALFDEHQCSADMFFLLHRDRAAADGKAAETGRADQRNYPFRFNVQIPRDPSLNSHGLTLTSQTPILVQEVTPGMTSSTTRQRCRVRSKCVLWVLLALFCSFLLCESLAAPCTGLICVL